MESLSSLDRQRVHQFCEEWAQPELQRALEGSPKVRRAIENFISAWYTAAAVAPEEVGRSLEGNVSSLTSEDGTDMSQRRQRREPGCDAKRLTKDDSGIGITIVLKCGTEISNRRLDLRKDISKGLGVDRRQVIIHDITTNLDETTIRVQIARVPRQERKVIWDRAFNEMVESEIGGVEVCDVEETTPGQAAEEGYESPDAEVNVQDRRGHDRGPATGAGGQTNNTEGLGGE